MRRHISGEPSRDNRPRRRSIFPSRRRRKKLDSAQASLDNDTENLSHQQTNDIATFDSIPQLSSLYDVAILHNSVKNAVDLDDYGTGLLNSTNNKSKFVSPSRNIMMCGLKNRSYVDKWEQLCDDPTVEESIECVFEHQLQEGIPMTVEEDDDMAVVQYYSDDDFQNYDSGKLVFVGSVSLSHTVSSLNESDHNVDIAKSVSSASSCLSCQSQTCDDFIARIPKKDWPISHLMLRPTPGSRTNVIGVRYANEEDYLKQWWDPTSSSLSSSTFCYKCCLPVNDGTEPLGRTLVVDFESDLFEGTMQLRIRNAKRLKGTPKTNELETGYFKGLNRHYQCVVRGRFKRQGIPMIHTYSGQLFQKPLKLPAQFIVQGGMKIMSFFAPMIQANLGSKRPYVLTPLGSSPQTIHVEDLVLSNRHQYRSDSTITEKVQEPVDNANKLIPVKCGAESCSTFHTKARKKAFDKLCIANDTSLTFQIDKIYTFEFLQHLIDFSKFEVSLGNIIGNHKLGKMINGQPMNVMSAYQYRDETTNQIKQESLWSFDLWHESILPN